MANSSDATSSSLLPRYGDPTFDCGGAQVRAQCRHLATVVSISGAIDAINVDRAGEYSSHFVLPDTPIVLDLSGLQRMSPQGIRLLHRVDDACRAAGVEWVLVASPAVTRVRSLSGDAFACPVVDSVREALRVFADAISARRRLLLPLLGKSA
ncbi:STAS domain-containing protein [Mycobacterium sp.]|uniref:STAS domain-containing protein n=1 Tax=Mycobacterium sp. TaxID=1785 RepID=UPI001282159F|nr:STAS domain-containing protein [Mycobacterium sp.]KAA8967067.1 MAG: STAS domain-containing protein [Mycobacterium sp.]